jgi:photosystem II stability/assembly factor-like uncharacterized protein
MYAACVGVAILAGVAVFYWGEGGGEVVARSPADATAGHGPALGRGGSWSPSGGPYGGPMTAVAVDPHTPRNVYAAALGGGVFKSTNAGRTWRAIDAGVAGVNRGALKLDPRHPRTVYLGNARGVFKSTDGGRSWQDVSDGLFDGETPARRSWRLGEGFVTRLAVAADSTLYASTYGGAFRSTGGSRWREIDTGLSVTRDVNGKRVTYPPLLEAVAVDPQRPQTVYVGGPFNVNDASVYKTTDGGRRWHSVGPAGRNVRTLVLDPLHATTVYAGTDRGIFVSRDGARSWRAAGMPAKQLYDLVLDRDGTTLHAGTSRGVLMSTDGGITWSGASGRSERSLLTLALDPQHPQNVYAGPWVGLVKSTDAGETWRAAHDGLAATFVISLAYGAGTLYVGTQGNGAFASSNGAASWRSIDTGLIGLPADVDALAVDPRTARTAYAGTATAGVFETLDGGLTWRAVIDGKTAKGASAIAIDPPRPQTVYVGTQGGVFFKTTNGGTTWQSTTIPSRVLSLAADPRHTGTLYAGGGGVWKSTDGGETWRVVAHAHPRVVALAIAASDPQTIYAAAQQGILKTTNGGETWAVSSATEVQALAVDPQNPRIVYAAGRSGLVRSANGGETWSSLNHGLSIRDVKSLVLDSTGATLYAGTYGGGVVSLKLPG